MPELITENHSSNPEDGKNCTPVQNKMRFGKSRLEMRIFGKMMRGHALFSVNARRRLYAVFKSRLKTILTAQDGPVAFRPTPRNRAFGMEYWGRIYYVGSNSFFPSAVKSGEREIVKALPYTRPLIRKNGVEKTKIPFFSTSDF